MGVLNMQFSDYVAKERHLAHLNLMKHRPHYERPYETVSADGSAVSGRCGWLFIREGSNGWERQLAGEYALTEQQLARYQQHHQQRLQWLAARAVSYAQVVFPEKQSVLMHQRWLTPRISDLRPAVQLSAVLGSAFVYPVQTLSEMAAGAELYYRSNSHTCLSGCWQVFLAVCAQLWPERAFDFDLLTLTKTLVQHDLMVKYTADCHEDIFKIQSASTCVFHNYQLETHGKHEGTHFILKNDAALYPENILIMGDSYAYDVGFSELFAAYFKEVHVIWGQTLDAAYIQQHAINTVVAETAERFLIRAPMPDRFD